jgi:hypothetical protein
MSQVEVSQVPLSSNQGQILNDCLNKHIMKFNELIKNNAIIDYNTYSKITEEKQVKPYSELIKKQLKNYYYNTIIEKKEGDSTQSDKYFISAIKVFDNDNNNNKLGTNEIYIPLDFVDIFNFTYPLYIPNIDNLKPSELGISKEVKNHLFYNMIDVNDEIFIYQTISRDKLMGFNYNNTHLSVLIKTKAGYVFSFGLIGGTGKEDIIKKGVFDFTSIKKAKIITPDKFLEYKLNYEVTNHEESESFVKLIAKTQLKLSHIEKIKAIFENIDSKINSYDDYKIELYLDYFDRAIFDKPNIDNKHIEVTIKNNNKIREIFTDKHDMIIRQCGLAIYRNTIELFQLGNDQRKYYLSPCFSYDYNPNDYCTLSRYSKQTKKNVNCSSFLQDLFNDIIVCSGSSIVSLSQYCHQKKEINSKPC